MVNQDENKWVEVYMELLRKEDDINFFILKNKNFPAFIYKYRALNSNTFDCLENDWLWASEPKYMNDPFESSLIIDNHQVFRAFISGDVFKSEFRKLYNFSFPERELHEIIMSTEPHQLFISVCSKLGIPLPSPEKIYKKATSEMGRIYVGTGKVHKNLLFWHFQRIHFNVGTLCRQP